MWIKVMKRRVRYKLVNLDTGESSWDRVEEWYNDTVWVGKKKYQKKPHHKKKGNNPKTAWREHKQIRRDKAKRQDLHGYHSDGCPVWMKRHCNKKHRQWERRCIEKEDWNNMHTKDRKRILDPWLWN